MIQIKMPAVPLAAPAGESSADRIGPHAVRADYAETAEAVRQRIRQQGLSGWDLVCVIDGDGRLLGTLTAPELLALPDATALGTVAARDGPTVSDRQR